MAEELKSIFCQYLDCLRSQFERGREEVTRRGVLDLRRNKNDELKQKVADVEQGSEFEHLVSITLKCFQGDYHKGDHESWRAAIKNFFRRSGYYAEMWEQAVEDQDLLQKYEHAFTRREYNIQYLALMEHVEFDKEGLDFDSFEIKRLSLRELEFLFSTPANQCFYPWASIEVGKIDGYWFIFCDVNKPIQKIGDSTIFLNSMDNLHLVDWNYTRYAKPIERVLHQLVLFDWNWDLWRNRLIGGKTIKRKLDEISAGWYGFEIPVAFEVHDDLLIAPSRLPEIPRFDTEPYFVQETGEEIERRAVYISINTGETELFESFMREVSRLFVELGERPKEWRFFEIAMGFLTRAFFSSGLEQLLWHITAIEAVLGENRPGLTQLIQKRISSILAKTKKEKKEIGTQFNELYKLRSRLIHGDEFKQAYIGQLRMARNFARMTIFWLLNYLTEVKSMMEKQDSVQDVPDHKDLLVLLDLEANRRNRIGKLIENAKDDFPFVNEWLE